MELTLSNYLSPARQDSDFLLMEVSYSFNHFNWAGILYIMMIPLLFSLFYCQIFEVGFTYYSEIGCKFFTFFSNSEIFNAFSTLKSPIFVRLKSFK